MGMDVQIGDSLIRIISAYAPTEVNPDTDSKDIFYSELEKTMKSKKKYSGILIGSDTNATNEVAKYRSYFGKDGILIPSSENTNDNGTRLECFVNNNKMCLSSTFFEKNRKIESRGIQMIKRRKRLSCDCISRDTRNNK